MSSVKPEFCWCTAWTRINFFRQFYAFLSEKINLKLLDTPGLMMRPLTVS